MHLHTEVLAVEFLPAPDAENLPMDLWMGSWHLARLEMSRGVSATCATKAVNKAVVSFPSSASVRRHSERAS
jgi:hypothetical protein